jgi:ABC-type nitrate/sulfonate/bicarbonate transport system substrate-binding protein
MDLIVTVPDDRVAFVKKLLRELNLSVKPAAKAKSVAAAKPKQYTPEQQEWIDDFREALHDVELHQQGKIKLKTGQELLDELSDNSVE